MSSKESYEGNTDSDLLFNQILAEFEVQIAESNDGKADSTINLLNRIIRHYGLSGGEAQEMFERIRDARMNKIMSGSSRSRKDVEPKQGSRILSHSDAIDRWQDKHDK